MLDIGLYIFYAFFVIAALAAVGFSLINMASKPGGLVRALISIGALLALFGVAYALSSGDVTARDAALGVTSGTSKLIGAALITFYIAFILAVIALVFTEISKAFK